MSLSWTKLSNEFSRTESRILVVLYQLDEFHLTPLILGHSGSAPETSWNALGTNQGTNADDSRDDPHPEAKVSQSQTTRNSGPYDGYDSGKFSVESVSIDFFSWNVFSTLNDILQKIRKISRVEKLENLMKRFFLKNNGFIFLKSIFTKVGGRKISRW